MAKRVKQQFRGAALRCFSLARGKQSEWRPRRSTRRLIALMFAGRNRMLMIRRELPRTSNADWAGGDVRMDIETDKSYFTHETDSPFFACGSVLLAQRNPRIRETGGRFSNFGSNMDRPGSHPFAHDD
jgi:hypothetical protein